MTKEYAQDGVRQAVREVYAKAAEGLPCRAAADRTRP